MAIILNQLIFYNQTEKLETHKNIVIKKEKNNISNAFQKKHQYSYKFA